MSIPESEGTTTTFIVNLCRLQRPSIPEHLPVNLEGLRPFLSRRTKDGEHRFYLHVGFFQSRTEAETWVNAARASYPNAFVSELTDAVRPSEPGSLPIADTHEMKVLEVRAPRHDEDIGEAELPKTTLTFDRTPWPKPSKPVKPKDAWSEVLAEANSRSTASSGVRHLRVEFQRPRDPSRKSPKPRK